ncbi:MAG TPA: alpha-2-macroglobulin family protein [Kofleriaceae bacterium]|nr:alpha-2-macroglobulin family protein [Kofleriaceae bacterium]
MSRTIHPRGRSISVRGALALALAAVACKSGSGGDRGPGRGENGTYRTVSKNEATDHAAVFEQEGAGSAAAAPAPTPAAPAAADLAGRLDDAERDEKKKDGKLTEARQRALGGEDAPGPGGGGGQGQTEHPTRAWFPETFLFEPLVVTDATGSATVPVRIPDRLTTWRVLALAHSRGGAQGGAVTSFLSTLPTYVDVVAPKALMRGDRVRLPVQLVNTTDKPVATTIRASATNATLAGGNGPRTIPAQGSLVEYLTLTADRPGTIELEVGLRGGDAVRHTIDVLPLGKPEVVSHSGTLAAPRTLTLTGPAGSDPATDRVRLQAFPGALALLRSELGVCTARTGVADDAYALLLDGRAAALLAALGDKADPDAVRSLEILETQRAVRDARTLDLDGATLLTEAALAHPDSPVLARLGERAAAYLGETQRPDGTFGGGNGWTLQRVLVTTAEATRAAATATATPADQQRARGVAIRASGVFERYDGQIDDAYTAAAILTSGAVSPAQADRLRARVREAITADADGARYLEAGDGVVRADGVVPSRAEATAQAALALAGDPASSAIVADLGATLLGSYDPAVGWGDGRANLVCMRAVVELFRTPITSPVTVTLTMDGHAIASGTLAADKLRDVLTLEAPAPGLAGAHEWKVTAEPAVPGLGYALALDAWVPWPTGERSAGLELSAPPTMTAQVGKPAEVALRAVAPSGLPLELRYGLPAGVQADTPSLEALVNAGTITRFVTADDGVTLEAPALNPGQTFNATFRVIPTLVGTLHGPASSIAGAGTTVHVPPSTWTVE